MASLNYPQSEIFVITFDNIINFETNSGSLDCVQTPIGTFSLRFIEKHAVNDLKKLFEDNKKKAFPYNEPAYFLDGCKICMIKLDSGYCFDLA